MNFLVFTCWVADCSLSDLIHHQYLVDNQRLSRELFYESLLRKFGNLDSIQLSEAPSLKAMAIKVGSVGRVTHSSAQPDLPDPAV